MAERSTRLSCFNPSRAIGKLVSLLWSRWISLEELIAFRFGRGLKTYLRFFSCCSDIGMDWMRLNERFRFSSLVSFPMS